MVPGQCNMPHLPAWVKIEPDGVLREKIIPYEHGEHPRLPRYTLRQFVCPISLLS